MLDRASTFADSVILELLKTEFVPVALDQAYQRRQQDTEGEFYRKIAAQSPRSDFQATTQGFYLATARGTLLAYNNSRGPERIRRLMRQKLLEYRASDEARTKTVVARERTKDPRYAVEPPGGGLVLRVRAKVLDGYEPSSDPWQTILHAAVSRDNLWITRREHRALVAGTLPASLARRIARFHLVDNTRGEPPMWKDSELVRVDLRLEGDLLRGSVLLETEDGDRGYRADLRGSLKVEEGCVVRFDLVAKGMFWGEGRYTQGAPRGEFPLAVGFALADGKDIADGIPPQGSRGWLRGYLAEPE